MDVAGTRASVDDIVARLERLPTSWWQVKARIIVGVATFFDAFDALAIASVLPVIVPQPNACAIQPTTSRSIVTAAGAERQAVTF